MNDAVGGDLRVDFRLGQYEPALQNRLRVQSEASCSPLPANSALSHRLGDVRLQLLRVPADAGVAGGPNCRVRRESLLHHRPDETGELGNLAREQVLPELEVTENALQR